MSHTKLVTGMTATSLRGDDESAGVAARKEVYREEKDAERPGGNKGDSGRIKRRVSVSIPVTSPPDRTKGGSL